ncbi:MAG TPA: bifunctional phosphoserine phosphatase/homoserine phosphotransferase ThrH [Roseiflexaceae bacterium]|nr:bifunctional phosphoserine phosphatase/homoserine phosphotransferase ThrH [Roseiflexaceae bacterium]
MPRKPTLIATDLEGVLVPEIWIAVAEKTGIERLRLTTRDIPDYDQLMLGRIAILHEQRLKLADIQSVIATLDPLPGALDYLEWARAHTQLIILSDTFYEFAAPLMLKLGYPTLFCNSLTIDGEDNIVGYRMRQEHGKRLSVAAFKSLQFQVVAIGDSYNDTAMLAAADAGILFRPPEAIAAEFPQFPVAREYAELRCHIEGMIDGD